MDEFDEGQFSSKGNVSKTFPMQCSALRKNGHVMIKGRPCKIVDMSTSKTGKHGHAKVNLVGVDIFTSKKYEEVSPSTHNLDVPVVCRCEYTLVDIDETGFAILLCNDGSTKENVRVPDNETGVALRKQFDEGRELLVTVLSACDEEFIVAFKDAPEGK